MAYAPAHHDISGSISEAGICKTYKYFAYLYLTLHNNQSGPSKLGHIQENPNEWQRYG